MITIQGYTYHVATVTEAEEAAKVIHRARSNAIKVPEEVRESYTLALSLALSVTLLAQRLVDSVTDPQAAITADDWLVENLTATLEQLKRSIPARRTVGTVKIAQLQELLQQFETAAGSIASSMKNAHQAVMGKDFDKAAQLLSKVDCAKLDELRELNDTMAGVVGLEG